MMNRSRYASTKSLLALDAATCATMGVVLLVGSAPIAGVTQIPAGLLFWAGASLMPVAAFMAISSRVASVLVWAAIAVVLGNLLWVAASILLPATGMIVPNPLGWAFLVGQAGFVAILAKLEFDALHSRAIAA